MKRAVAFRSESQVSESPRTSGVWADFFKNKAISSSFVPFCERRFCTFKCATMGFLFEFEKTSYSWGLGPGFCSIPDRSSRKKIDIRKKGALLIFILHLIDNFCAFLLQQYANRMTSINSNLRLVS